MNRFPIFLLAAIVVAPNMGFAQGALKSPWRESVSVPLASQVNSTLSWLSEYRSQSLNMSLIRSQVANAAKDRFGRVTGKAVPVLIPRADGTVSRFMITEFNLLSDDLQNQMPTCRSYYGYNADNKVERIHLGFTNLGFHSTVYSPAGDEFIDPVILGNQGEYFVYNRKNLRQDPNNMPVCATVGEAQISPFDGPGGGGPGTESVGGTLKTYRLALNASKEYTTAVGGTIPLAEAAMIVAVNRVTGVYEIDFGIRLNLTYKKAYTAADAFNFTNSNGVTMLAENQSQCDSLVGTANYDVGHVFSTGGGGVAGLGVTGTAGQKARGVTGLPVPTGDAFYIDYVAHEMGHQFGGNHTFNGTAGSCSGNRAASAAYEPGSGSTIMPYAGICGADDLQPHSDAYFHAKSIEEIVARRQLGSSGGTAVANGNIAPVVNAGAAYTIPISTPFKLTGSATDANGDALTYCWEQYNLGSTNSTTNTASGVLFRSYNPTTAPYRTFPKLSTVLANATDQWEALPIVARTMAFRMTVRDNRAGGGENNFGATTITVSGGAFSVTAPNTAVSWPAGSTQTVTWNKGGTTSANVKILLSTVGGTDFDSGGFTTILASTPNDGSETITVPAVASTTCRIKVEPTDNIYFDVSNVNFTITASQNVTGNVTLQHILPSPAGQVVALQIFAPGGTIAQRTTNVVLDASGNYSYTVSPTLPAGNYDVRLKSSHWLARRVVNQALTATGALGVSASLLNGDSQPDNVIDLSDYTILVSAFNGTLATADLNLDGIVDLSDYTILVTNFNSIGDN